MKILEAICSLPQMECNLCFPSQLAAIEASFIQLKPELLKPLSSQPGGQHPSAGKRVCSVVREEQPGHAIPTTHISCPNHSHSCRSSLLLGHKGVGHPCHGATLCSWHRVCLHLMLPALQLCSLFQLWFGSPWTAAAGSVTLLLHSVPVPC